jgi:hypothetical protein
MLLKYMAIMYFKRREQSQQICKNVLTGHPFQTSNPPSQKFPKMYWPVIYFKRIEQSQNFPKMYWRSYISNAWNQNRSSQKCTDGHIFQTHGFPSNYFVVVTFGGIEYFFSHPNRIKNTNWVGREQKTKSANVLKCVLLWTKWPSNS